MVERRSKRTETADASRVEYLLGLLTRLSQYDPSPALRERLEILSSQRLRVGVESGKPFSRLQSGLLLWLRPVFVAILLIVIGIVAALVAHVRQSKPLRAGIESPVAPPKAPLSSEIHAQPATPSTETKLPKTRHSLPGLAQNITPRRMILQLPYSNSALDTGTDTTIRVSMSQAELVSLGFPMNTTIQDRRVVAELTLGDDGLPRAISVPLPFEVIREKK